MAVDKSNELILGTWKGLVTYRCPHCPFDSLDRGMAVEHVYETHVKPGCRKPVLKKAVPANPYLRVQPEDASAQECEKAPETITPTSDNQS